MSHPPAGQAASPVPLCQIAGIQQLLDQFDGHNEIPLQTIIEGN